MYDDMLKVTARGEALHTVMRPMPTFGMSFGRRMVVIANGAGELLLMSPFVPPEDVAGELDTLGTVTAIVVPTKVHDTFLGEVTKKWPAATYYVCEGAERFVDTVPTVKPLDQLESGGWGKVLRARKLEGAPMLNEWVFLDRRNKTLLVSDFIFDARQETGTAAKLWSRMLGVRNEPGPSRLFRAAIRDKAAFCACLREIQTWDFEAIIPSHFAVIESGGKAVFDEIAGRVCG